jgi:hypothetical protein
MALHLVHEAALCVSGLRKDRSLTQKGFELSNGLPFVPTDSAIHELLQNDGTLEAAQRIAGHADSRTTKLYDRRGQKVLLEDMERIRY